MAFLSTVYENLLYGTFTPSLQLFLFSLVLLIVGVAAKVWSDGVNLGSIEHKPLSWIESTHPHLPSAQTVLMINICAVALLAVGLQTMQGVFPFNDPYQGLNLITLFVLVTAVGTLAGLKWSGAKIYAYAFILGTSIAFLTLSLLYSIPGMPGLEQGMLLSCTLLAGGVATWMIVRKASSREQNRIATWITALVCLFWILTYMFQ